MGTAAPPSLVPIALWITRKTPFARAAGTYLKCTLLTPVLSPRLPVSFTLRCLSRMRVHQSPFKVSDLRRFFNPFPDPFPNKPCSPKMRETAVGRRCQHLVIAQATRAEASCCTLVPDAMVTSDLTLRSPMALEFAEVDAIPFMTLTPFNSSTEPTFTYLRKVPTLSPHPRMRGDYIASKGTSC